MARAAWKGTIRLGQLGIPVRLYTGLRPSHPRFVQLHDKDGSPVERVLQCRSEHRAIPLSEVEKAIEYEPGKYLALTNHELEQAMTIPTKAIAIIQFCPSSDIEPAFFERPFYVVPSKGGERGYALLRTVFAKLQRTAITQFIIYGKQRLGALGAQDDILVLNQLRYAAELVSRNEIRTPSLPKPSPAETDILTAVIERFSSPFYIRDYRDNYADHVNQLIERKLQGLPPQKQERIEPSATPEADITTVLQDILDTKVPQANGTAIAP